MLTAGGDPLPAVLVCRRIGYNFVRLPGGKELGERWTHKHSSIWLIVGAVAGWLAGMVVKGGGFGLIGDIIVGMSAHSSLAGCRRGLA